MRRRILVAMLSIAVLAVGLFAVPLAIVVERFVDENATLRVQREAVLAAREVPENFSSRTTAVDLPAGRFGVRLALYDVHGSLAAGDGPVVADAVAREALSGRVVDSESDSTRVVAVPVSVDEQIIGVIRAEQSTAASDARTQQIVLVLGLLAVGVVAIAAGVGFVIAGRLARPVREVRDAAVRLGHGDFALDVPRSRIPEIDQAAVAIRVTAARLDDLVARERSFSADVSHQLRTPLAGLRAALETELEFPRPDASTVLRESLDDIDRLERTITELLSIARSAQADGDLVDLALVFEELRAGWRGRFAHANRSFVVGDPSGAPTVRGNAVMLRHALDVLVDNALHHGDGVVRVSLHADAESATITVSDEGAGFDHGERIDGEPRRVGALGLPLAQRLVEALPGRLVYRRTEAHPEIDIVLQLVHDTGLA